MDDPRIIHVRFKDLMDDHVGTVRSIYEQAGLAFAPEFEKNIVEWLAVNRPDRYGKFSYSLSDFGVNADDLPPLFQRYVERFNLHN